MAGKTVNSIVVTCLFLVTFLGCWYAVRRSGYIWPVSVTSSEARNLSWQAMECEFDVSNLDSYSHWFVRTMGREDGRMLVTGSTKGVPYVHHYLLRSGYLYSWSEGASNGLVFAQASLEAALWTDNPASRDKKMLCKRWLDASLSALQIPAGVAFTPAELSL